MKSLLAIFFIVRKNKKKDKKQQIQSISVYCQKFIRTLNANPIKLAVANVVVQAPAGTVTFAATVSLAAAASLADNMRTTVAIKSTKKSCFIILKNIFEDD